MKKKEVIFIFLLLREEFNLPCGIRVGIDYKNNILVIDRETSREYTQKFSAKGNLTIPLDLREKIHSNKFYILIEQCEEKIILAPIMDG
jgi:hypothetical protein